MRSITPKRPIWAFSNRQVATPVGGDAFLQSQVLKAIGISVLIMVAIVALALALQALTLTVGHFRIAVMLTCKIRRVP